MDFYFFFFGSGSSSYKCRSCSTLFVWRHRRSFHGYASYGKFTQTKDLCKENMFSTNLCNCIFFFPQDINFWGSVYCTFFASSYLKKSRGKIVVIASGCGCIASPRLSFYCVTLFYPFAFSYLFNLLILKTHLISLIFSWWIQASKAAVIAFYETLRIEFGSKVGVTIVAPGVVDSEMTQGKFMTKNGQFIVDKELRDVSISGLIYDLLS